MKKSRQYFIRLNIIVPIIFSCLAILTLVVTYRLTLYSIDTHGDTISYLAAWGIAVVLFTFIAGWLISRTILKPVEAFVREAEKLPAMQQSAPEFNTKDELSRYTQVFTQITDFLSKMDARELFPEIVGQSKVIRSVLSQIIKVAPTDVTVLITGESGTGKELVAQAILKHSKRREGPYIAVNCAAIPQGLLESELFGHEKGAFTGAVSQKKGKFELADKGTLFLDEIGDMPLETQAKILRALENGTCERVGGTQSISFDVRVIAATNKDFVELIKNGQFREDLFHRLNVFPIHLPPLRHRREDIPILAEYFLEKHEKDIHLSPEAIQVLLVSPWPGNIRELRNIMERAAVLAEDGTILPKHLTGLAIGESEHDDELALDEGVNLDDKLEGVERSIIIAALTKTGGVQVRAAEILGIKERSLWHRIRKYEIDVKSLKMHG
ncbi:sigma-54 interaction domain-containing protein [Oceanidesulfovibrio marinus]|uniref:HAMP domain-containing protein n=2 Tax=Oceanidesulfovibrio marinus TaxID=370038 RepID=A0A6P1ZG45_9BACT|nr:sigma-54 dependent transcriptional regulator [Oceanidesulfovibrio marinus]QJT08377.1 HAMP domain-containing protein [Oceanidesulfovibrio marinus]TVM33152.1 sigma-54-dependent Fis family transcriptional regulator [Oceanidesulfovibrio marinus]